jgi:predicted nucleotidyltransferase component of viral defense system
MAAPIRLSRRSLDAGGSALGNDPPSLSGSIEELIIDVNMNEQPFLAPEHVRLTLPYSDLSGREHVISVVSLAEILGNKWFMLGDNERNEPRDLYDVWAGLCRFRVPFSELARGHLAKYGFRPLRTQLTLARRLESAWEVRLRHQLRDLPNFQEVWEEVDRSLREWQEG